MNRTAQTGPTLQFGDFVVSPRSHTLEKHGIRVKLQGQPFEILLMLLERPGDVVTREALQSRLWPENTFVDFENGVNAAVKNLRHALSDPREQPRYIETVPKVGYRFIAQVRAVGDKRPEPTIEIDSGRKGAPRENTGGTGADAGLLAPPNSQKSAIAAAASAEKNGAEIPGLNAQKTLPGIQDPAPVPRARTSVAARRLLFALTSCAVLVVVVALARPVVPLPRVERLRQITHVGTVALNQGLLISGSRIYFIMQEKGENQIRYVSLEDGAVVPVEKPFTRIELRDIFPSGSELLIGEIVQGFPAGAWRRTLWRLPSPPGTARRVGTIFADDAAWSPDGRTIVYTDERDQSLNVVDADGGNASKLASLPGRPFKPRWSPDGKVIRTSVINAEGDGISLWQLDASGRNLGRMLPGWSASSRAWTGRWTRDGRYFLFTGLQKGTRNIWALRDKKDLLRRNGDQPAQLTDGPVNFYQPVASRDNKTVYAVGTQSHGQLMRYDPRSQQFEPHLNGLSVDNVTFSRDGKWMAYVTYPEGSLIRSRVDGSDRLQLTFGPMRVLNPQWAPDGSLIAFDATSDTGADQKMYVIPANGGPARLAAPGSAGDQGFPGWSVDGQFLLFGSSDGLHSEWALHSLNVKTQKQTVLPGTLGLVSGTMSPDGRYIAALAGPSKSLVLYDVTSGATRQLAQLADYPCWSSDGKYIYYSTLMWGVILGSEKAAIYRVNVANGSIERPVPTPTFPLAGNWGFWSGLAPDGSILVLRDLGSSDIYALDAELP